MDPYNADPYASTPVRYPTTSYVTLTPSSHGSAVMQGAYDGQNGAGARSDGTRDAQAKEIPGAPAGNVRYRCMTLPVNDGDDIEDVIAQVGLDGVKCFAVGDETNARRAFELPRIAKWSMTDPTILTINAKDGAGETSFALSADAKTIAALVDVLTTSAFQWCELNGLDAMDTIVSSGSDWMNLKATTVGSGATATSSAAGIRFWETPEYSGWLTKQGEMLRTWRKRWFVLKQGHLVWFKTNVVNERAVTRGEIPRSNPSTVCPSRQRRRLASLTRSISKALYRRESGQSISSPIPSASDRNGSKLYRKPCASARRPRLGKRQRRSNCGKGLRKPRHPHPLLDR